MAEAPAAGRSAQPTDDWTISVVVSSFSARRLHDLRELALALEAQAEKNFEAVFVVDGSHSLYEHLEQELPKTVTYPFKVVFNEEDRGLSFSRNAGIRAATGSIVAFLDDDAVPDPHWSKELAEVFCDLAVVAVAGHVTPIWQKPDMDWFPLELRWMISCTYFPLENNEVATRNGFGANMAFRKEAFRRVGEFREDLGLRPGVWIGGEDTEMFIRLREAGIGRVLFHPRVAVGHKIPEARLSAAALKKRASAAGKSMALTRSVLRAGGNKNYLDAERGYLADLLSRVLVRETLYWIRSRSWREIRRPATILRVTVWAGIGFARQYARRRSTS